MDDPTNSSFRAPPPRTRPRRTPGGNGFVVTQGVDSIEDRVAATSGTQARRGTPVAIPEGHIELILVFNGTEHVIGEGQLRNITVNMTPDDIEVTAFGDPRRTFLRRPRHITIDLEVER